MIWPFYNKKRENTEVSHEMDRVKALFEERRERAKQIRSVEDYLNWAHDRYDVFSTGSLPFAHDFSEELNGLGLDIGYWAFAPASRSNYARNEGEDSVVCPVLDLSFRYQKDLVDQNIDQHSGNWSDDWILTSAIRDTLNKTLALHGFSEDYISKKTFIFANSSVESVALGFHGSFVRRDIERYIEREGFKKLRRIYWVNIDAVRTFYLEFSSKSEARRAKTLLRNIHDLAKAAIIKRDEGSLCPHPKFDVQVVDKTHSTFHLFREDWSLGV